MSQRGGSCHPQSNRRTLAEKRAGKQHLETSYCTDNVPTIPSARGTFPGHTRQWFRRPSWWPRCPEIVADPKKISNHLPWLTFQLGFCWPRNNVGGVAVTDITFHGFNQLVSLFAHEWHDSTDTCHAVSWTWTPSLAIPIWLGNRCQGWLKAL